MTDFDLEQCKKLKDWGMPQRVGRGGWIWWIGDIDEHFKGRPLLLGVDVVQIQLDTCPSDWILIPSLDELMEFARGLSEGWCLKPGPESGWRISRMPDWWDDDNPKLAVYALIAKLKEVESEDQQ